MSKSRMAKMAEKLKAERHTTQQTEPNAVNSPPREVTESETPEMRERRRVAVEKLRTFLAD